MCEGGLQSEYMEGRGRFPGGGRGCYKGGGLQGASVSPPSCHLPICEGMGVTYSRGESPWMGENPPHGSQGSPVGFPH